MASIRHSIEYVAVLTGIKLAQMLSPKMADRFASALGSISCAVATSRRRIAHENLRRAFGDSLTEEQRRVIVRNVFRNTARTLIEFARFGKLGLDGLNRIVEGPEMSQLHEALKRGKGAIFVSSHFGNWEMMGSWVAAQDRKSVV